MKRGRALYSGLSSSYLVLSGSPGSAASRVKRGRAAGVGDPIPLLPGYITGRPLRRGGYSYHRPAFHARAGNVCGVRLLVTGGPGYSRSSNLGRNGTSKIRTLLVQPQGPSGSEGIPEYRSGRSGRNNSRRSSGRATMYSECAMKTDFPHGNRHGDTVNTAPSSVTEVYPDRYETPAKGARRPPVAAIGCPW